MKTLILMLLSFSTAWAQIDKDATFETSELYKKLEFISLSFKGNQKILLGHQNAFIEGRGWQKKNADVGSELVSDMHKVSGVHPSVYGLDFLSMGDWNYDIQIDQIKEVHRRGGVITMSWHMNTLINDGKGKGDFYDTTAKVVTHILPGGKAHKAFTDELDRFVSFTQLISDIPIIFRPFHEHNGSWFWWGQDHCTRDEYIALWRFTVNYLKSKGVHNLLYAYSPNHINGDYFERYPGDEYVDILGVDMYFSNHEADKKLIGPWPQLKWKNDVIWLMREADKRKKIPAITEFGQESITYDRFWTDYFGWPLEREGVEQLTGKRNLPNRGIAFILLWRNSITDPKHYYGPIPGHELNDNFMSLLSKGIFVGM